MVPPVHLTVASWHYDDLGGIFVSGSHDCAHRSRLSRFLQRCHGDSQSCRVSLPESRPRYGSNGNHPKRKAGCCHGKPRRVRCGKKGWSKAESTRLKFFFKMESNSTMTSSSWLDNPESFTKAKKFSPNRSFSQP